MDKKTAIIIGVIILVLSSIITPFILKKINNKANDISQGTQVEEVSKQNESGEQLEDKPSSGEANSNEEEQIGSGDESEEQKLTEISGEQKSTEQENGNTTNENETTSSQGTKNQTTQSAEEKNNVPTNVDEEIINEDVQNIEVIEVVQNHNFNEISKIKLLEMEDEKYCAELEIMLKLEDNTKYYISLIKKPTSKRSLKYKKAYKIAEKIISYLYFIQSAMEMSNSYMNNQNVSLVPNRLVAE